MVTMVSSEGDSFSSCIKLVKRSPNAFAICTWPEVNIYYFLPGAKITFSSLPLSLHCWIFPSFFLTTSHRREINTLDRNLGRSETMDGGNHGKSYWGQQCTGHQTLHVEEGSVLLGTLDIQTKHITNLLEQLPFSCFAFCSPKLAMQ